MKLVITSRSGGKTATLLEWMRVADDRVMLCATAQEVDRLRQQNRDIDPERFQWPQSMYRLRGRRVTVAVDNADWVLANLLRPFQVDVLSLTYESSDVYP